ncbi:hypothetical protein AB0J83_05260 [Actinoplanes sp. NPDC049596]|uniref:hypothetical protein n=1 Tax=unclassified Actinoplanes TaxID=2626549 RepID=UPI0034444403
MGLFRTDEPLDQALAGALRTGGRSRKIVAKGQDGIRAALTPGEPVLAVAVDELTYDGTLVVAGRRLLSMRRGGRELVLATDVTALSSAYLEENKGFAVLVAHQAGVRLHLADRAAAAALAQQINDLVVRHRPRAVPALHPTFYGDVLEAAGVPDTSVNRDRLAERTAYVLGTQAAAFTAQLRDPQAFKAFSGRFALAEPGRLWQRADDMIDWLWAWNPGCHEGLVKWAGKWHSGLLEPGSFLTAAAGGEIPPFGDRAAGDDSEAWRLVFERHHRG